MVSNVSNVIPDLKEDEDEFDITSFVQDQREMMNELMLKRAQVHQLRKDLDAANLKSYELSRSLEKSDGIKTDLEFNLNLMAKRVKTLEDKLRDRKDSSIKGSVNHESLTFEKNTLKDMLEKTYLEKNKLLRTIEDLNLLHQNDAIYRDELKEKDTQIRKLMSKCTETVEKLENDCKLIDVSDTVQLCQSYQKSLEFYTKQNNTLKDEHQILEDKYIQCNAKLETLENLLQSFPLQEQKTASIYYDRTEKIIQTLHCEITTQQEQMQILTAKLKAEIEANAQFCERDEATALEVENLTYQLKNFNKNVVNVSTQTDVEMQ